MLYVFGGRVPLAGFQTLRPSKDIVHNTVEMFDTWHGCWVQCPPMPHNRAGATAVCLQDGRLLLCGGYDERGVVEGLLSACDAYSPSEERWEAGVAHLLRGRWGHSCATLNGKVYAVGGCSGWQPGMPHRGSFMETLSSCEVLSEESGELCWQSCGSLQVPRSGARVVTLGEKYLVAVGGCEDPFGRVQMQASVELYDTDIGCWSLLDVHLSSPRTCAVVAALDDDHIVVAGGASIVQPPGAPAFAVEVLCVQAPSGKNQLASMDDGKSDEDKNKNSALMRLESDDGVPDSLIGRVGCQSAVVHLPSHSQGFPLCNQRCLVAIGGERCDRAPEAEMFSRVFNLDTGTWANSELLPPLHAKPRTAVALCVGSGRVAGARLHHLTIPYSMSSTG